MFSLGTCESVLGRSIYNYLGHILYDVSGAFKSTASHFQTVGTEFR